MKHQIDIHVDDKDSQPQYQDRKPEIFNRQHNQQLQVKKSYMQWPRSEKPKRFEDYVMSFETDEKCSISTKKAKYAFKCVVMRKHHITQSV